MERTQDGQIRYINPDTLPTNPAFTNAIIVTGHVKTMVPSGIPDARISEEMGDTCG